MRIYPAVKNLLFIHISIYLLQKLAFVAGDVNNFTHHFALNYQQIVGNGKIWSVFTYMFLHGSFLHLFFNMLILFFISNELEATWGSKKFLQYYLLTGVGAGLFILGTTAVRILFLNDPFAISEFTIGASGAIFGLLLAYSLLFAERQITLLIFFIIPLSIRGKYLVWVSLLFTVIFSPISGSAISHSGHIGGILAGMVFFAIFGRRQPYYFAYNQMLLFFREMFSMVRSNKLKPIRPQNRPQNAYKNRFFDQKQDHYDHLDEKNMSEREIEEQIDYLLDKISAKGLRGLSVEEKNFLNRISVMYQHKFPQ